jgi:hypothetical protein
MKHLIKFSRLCGMIGLMVGLSRYATADVSMSAVSWESGIGDTLGWTTQGDANPATSPTTGGHPGGFLSINFDPSPLMPQTGSVSGPGFAGNYTDLTLQFDLLGYATSVQQLYFVSSAPGAVSTWYLTLVNPPVQNQTWQTYNVSFQQQGSWYTGDSASFFTALSQVDSIGLILNHGATASAMQYGLDNWQFSQFFVPEPGVTAMAGIVLLSMAFWGRRVFRARRG